MQDMIAKMQAEMARQGSTHPPAPTNSGSALQPTTNGSAAVAPGSAH